MYESDEDDEDDWESDDGDDGDWDDDEAETEPCPHCGEPIPEDASRCPYCENYLSREDAPPRRKPWWIIVGAVLALGVAATWAVGW